MEIEIEELTLSLFLVVSDRDGSVDKAVETSGKHYTLGRFLSEYSNGTQGILNRYEDILSKKLIKRKRRDNVEQWREVSRIFQSTRFCIVFMGETVQCEDMYDEEAPVSILSTPIFFKILKAWQDFLDEDVEILLVPRNYKEKSPFSNHWLQISYNESTTHFIREVKIEFTAQ